MKFTKAEIKTLHEAAHAAGLMCMDAEGDVFKHYASLEKWLRKLIAKAEAEMEAP